MSLASMSASGPSAMPRAATGPHGASGGNHLVFGINRIQRSALALGLRQAWERDAQPHPPDLAASAAQAVLRDVLPARSNLRVMDWATRPQLPELLGSGCHVHLSPAPFDHTRLFLVDERWALVGSTNWDARSLRLNFEYNLACIDEELVRQLDAVLAARLQGARRLVAAELEAMPWPARLRNGLARLMSPYL